MAATFSAQRAEDLDVRLSKAVSEAQAAAKKLVEATQQLRDTQVWGMCEESCEDS